MPRVDKPNAALIEDIEWMLTGHESFWGAAQRLRMKPDSLERQLARCKRYDLVTKLRANQYSPTDHFHH